MLSNPTSDKLRALRLDGMNEALEEQRRNPDISAVDFEERLAWLVERQWLGKTNRALAARLQQAQLKVAATLEDIDYRHPRGLKRGQIDQLRAGDLLLGPLTVSGADLSESPKAGELGFHVRAGDPLHWFKPAWPNSLGTVVVEADGVPDRRIAPEPGGASFSFQAQAVATRLARRDSRLVHARARTRLLRRRGLPRIFLRRLAGALPIAARGN